MRIKKEGTPKRASTAFFGTHGVALFLVLWVLTFLSVIVGEFCYAMRTQVTITRNLKEKTTAYYIALAGIYRGIDETLRYHGAPNTMTNRDQQGADDVEWWRVNADIPQFPYKDGYFKIKIDNQSGKVDLNQVERPLLLLILGRSGLTDMEKDTIADSVLDWRDKDELHRLNGAENDYYGTLDPPYSCKDADFDSVEELLLVRGVTESVYHALLKHVFTVSMPQGLKPLKQTAETEKKKEIEKININAASTAVLLSLPGMSEENVAAVLDYRKEKDIVSLGALIPLIGQDNYIKIIPYITLKSSPFYIFHSVGQMEGSRASHYLKALVEVDVTTMRKYRIVKWWDQPEN